MASFYPRCVAALLLVFGTGAFAAERLLVSVNEIATNGDPVRYVSEWTIGGSGLGTRFQLPAPGGNTSRTEGIVRDLTLDDRGDVLVYNGTFAPYLYVWGDATSEHTSPGFNTTNNLTYGGIAYQDGTVFVCDMGIGGDPQGVLAFDRDTFATSRFATDIEPIDVNIGLDGTMLVLDGTGSPRDEVYLYDPVSRTEIDVVPIQRGGHRAVAGDADGTFFTADLDGVIRHFDRRGRLLRSLDVPGLRFCDIDIARDGTIALGTCSDGEVVVTDRSLLSFSCFEVSGGRVDCVFVTFSPFQGRAAPAPAVVNGIRKIGGDVQIDWRGTAGVGYVFERSADGQIWSPDPVPVSATGGDQQLDLPIGDNPTAWFRFVLPEG